MRLEFEKWYTEKINESDAKELFNEACLCYKVGAYRAAFLMSYLGFQSVLKERILKAKAPNGFPQPAWDIVHNKLRNDKEWDDEVAETVNRIKPANPFLISDDLRKQYQYFRCIRNDCAHAKSNIISYPHVESLWLFIKSNCSKFVINGGRDGLLERINVHYNPTYTKPGSDITPIIEDIHTSMNIAEIPSFLKDVYELMNELSWHTPLEDEDLSDFWDGIVFSANHILIDALTTFVKEDWKIFNKFINKYPHMLLDILQNSSEHFQREFWNEQIFKIFSTWKSNRWDILRRTLESDIIPNDELAEFIKKLSTKVGKMPPKESLEYFRSIGYLDELKRKFFGNGNNFNSPGGIDYANYHWDSIKALIVNIELDYDIISQLNRAFTAASYGTYYNGMKNLLKDDVDFRNKYKEILIKNSCSVPEYILELEECEAE